LEGSFRGVFPKLAKPKTGGTISGLFDRQHYFFEAAFFYFVDKVKNI